MKVLFLCAALVTIKSGFCQSWSTNAGNLYTTSGVGIGTSTPVAKLDVNGSLQTAGSINIDLGDLYLMRVNTPFGYVVRPNVTGFKKLQFAVTGGGPLEELALNSTVSYFTGKVGIGNSTPVSPLHVTGNRISIINSGEARLHLWNQQPVVEWLLGQKSGSNNNYTISTSAAGSENDMFTITPNGKVGIGIVGNTALFTVQSSQEEIGRFNHTTASNSRIVVSNTTGAINLGVGASNPNGYLWSSTDNIFIGSDGATPTMFIKGMNGGSIGIGTSNPGTNKLAVEGTIAARKVKVTQVSPWPDYVFKKGYPLRTLKQVEHYIYQNGHLPEMQSAQEVEKNGIDVGDTQAALLKKIEELTLYMIEMRKEIDELRKNQSEH